MKKELSKTEAKEKIDLFFQRKKFESEDLRKIKRLAMQKRIRLGQYRRRFCKKCYSDLTQGLIRITKTHRITICNVCKSENKVKLGV